MKAFNLRGTNGSGKTFVARRLLVRSNAIPVRMVRPGKPLIYQGQMFDKPLFILGSYQTQCGGCDTIDSVKKVAALLEELLPDVRAGVVFYEGLMISHMIGTVGAVAKKYNDQHVMGFLDTPLAVCIERVKARRLEKGNTIPFDPNKTLVGDYRAVSGARRNAMAQGFNVVDINYERAEEEVVEQIQQLAAQV